MTNSTEQLIVATGANKAPRVTPADIEAQIESEHYFTAADGVLNDLGPEAAYSMPESLLLLTFCVLVLRNGFTVTGESACASPENFNAEVGRNVARQHAVDKCWALLGYELRTKLTQRSEAYRMLQERLDGNSVRMPATVGVDIGAETGDAQLTDQEREFQKAALDAATLASHPPVTVHDDGRLEFMRATPAESTPEVPGMPPHQVRMRFERDELAARTNRLQRFIDSEDFAELTEEEQFLMEDQLSSMQRYLSALLGRIALFNKEQDNA